jgi:nitroreductase
MKHPLIEQLRQRRSARKFTAQTVEADKVELLVEAVLRAPTSRGRRPWDFIVIDEQAMLARLGSAKQHGSAFLGGAPLAVVVTADPEKSDVWIEDCSIAAIIVQLAAQELGLASCWAQIRLRPHNDYCSADEYLKALLDLPAGHVVECVIGIGYPEESLPGHSADSLPYSQAHRNRFKA